MNTTNWTHDDYKAFALIYAAYVDGSFADEEREMIINQVGGDRATKIEKEGRKLSDYECLQILQGEREKYYPGTEGKETLLKEISKLFSIDGVFSQLEKVVLQNLKRLL